MSEDQIQALINAVKSNSFLQERCRAAADLDAVLAIAKEAGFAATKEAVIKAQAQQSEKLSDEELEKVAGGVRQEYTADYCVSVYIWCDSIY